MKKTLLFSSLFLCVGSLMAQNQQISTVEEMMRQHLTEELQRHGYSEQQPERSSDHKPTMGVKAPVAQTMEAAVQQCDSIVRYTAYGTPDYKQEFTYDADGHRTARLESWWNGVEWSLSYKSEYDFDVNGYQTSETSYSYWSETETWLESSRSEYAYDEQGHQLNYISYYWNGEAWEASYKTEYTYDANGYQTGYASYNYMNGEWVGSSKNEYSYDDNGRETGYAYYYWSDGGWYGSWKSEYTYDEFGHQTSYTSYNWVDGAWLASNKYEYAFDAEGYELGYYSYYYQNGEWVLSSSSKNEYTFDDNGLPASIIRYYSYDGTTWSIDYKREYTYDANGNKLSEIYYWWSSYNESWQMNYKYEYTYDARGHQLSNYYYSWGGSDWYLQNTTDMTYDSFGNQTSYIYYGWRNGQWTGMDRNEHSYDESGRSLGSTYYSWYEGDWIVSSTSEYSYDANGNQTGSTYANTRDAYSGPVTLKVDLSNDPLGSYIDQQDLLFTGDGYKLNALYVDEYVGEMTLEEVTIWENQGYGDIAWNGLYRFSDQGHATGEEIYAFSSEDWNVIKEGTVRVDLELLTDWPNIRITTGWWSATYGGEEHNCLDLVQTDEDGNKYILLNIKEDGNLYENLDSQHLLFTGDNYKLLGLRILKEVPAEQSQTLWENNGTHGEINWSGEYRFANDQMMSGEEIYAFSMEEWDMLKTGTFYVDLVGVNPQIRVTTGWWSTTWTGADIQPGNDLLTDNGDGTWTLEVNFEGDPILDVIDQQHLLFTGGGYTVLRIRAGQTNPEDWEHRCIWQNNADDFINWSGTYRFGQEGHEGDCIATFNATDWDLIKKGYLTAEIETNNPNELMIYVTSGWWSTMFTGNYIQFGSNLLSGKIVPVLTGNSKEESTYDEQGNLTSRSIYRWIWDEKAWELSYTEIYYYSTNDVTDLDEILTGVRSRLSKEMRDGKVFIVVGDKTYTLDGQLVK